MSFPLPTSTYVHECLMEGVESVVVLEANEEIHGWHGRRRVL